MEPYAIYKGTSNADIGVFMEQLPDEIRPRRNIEEIQIPGKDGRAAVDLGSYDIGQTSMKVNCNGHTPTEVYAWLRGEGWLTTSNDPEYMRWVSFYDQIGDSRFRTAEACYDTLNIPMRVQPYKYLVNAADDYMDLTEEKVFEGKGNDDALPVLEITGSGDINLMINGMTVLIDGLNGTLMLDCDTKTPYTDENGVMQFAGRKVTVIDEWPRLLPGSNAVSWTGSVSRLRIRPWWRWL